MGSWRECQTKRKSFHLLMEDDNRRGQMDLPEERVTEFGFHDQEGYLLNSEGGGTQAGPPNMTIIVRQVHKGLGVLWVC